MMLLAENDEVSPPQPDGNYWPPTLISLLPGRRNDGPACYACAKKLFCDDRNRVVSDFFTNCTPRSAQFPAKLNEQL